MKRLMLFACVLFAVTIPACKIVKHDSLAKQGSGDQDISSSDSGFNPKTYAQSIWEPKVLPYISARAADVGEVLGGLNTSADEISKKYGYRVGDEGSFFNFAVKGKFKILKVDTESRNGLAYADVKPYDGKEDCIIQVGPVFKGSAIRDILDFISLNSFENQVEFARLGGELNNKVRDTVIGTTDLASMAGKEYEIIAVFTQDGASPIPVMTPVSLKKSGE